jgi:hypothetical protein
VQLGELAAGAVDRLELPGIGPCPTAVVPLDDDPSGRLVLARISQEPFGPEDVSLLRGMSRVLTLTLRLLRVLVNERALREQSERQAADKARLLGSLQERQQLLEQLAQLQRCTLSARRSTGCSAPSSTAPVPSRAPSSPYCA